MCVCVCVVHKGFSCVNSLCKFGFLRPGVTAGKAAQMEVVVVPSLPKQSHLYTSADEVINSLLDLRPEKWGLPPFQDCKILYLCFNKVWSVSLCIGHFMSLLICYCRDRRYSAGGTLVYWWSCHKGIWTWLKSAWNPYWYLKNSNIFLLNYCVFYEF